MTDSIERRACGARVWPRGARSASAGIPRQLAGAVWLVQQHAPGHLHAGAGRDPERAGVRAVWPGFTRRDRQRGGPGGLSLLSPMPACRQPIRHSPTWQRRCAGISANAISAWPSPGITATASTRRSLRTTSTSRPETSALLKRNSSAKAHSGKGPGALPARRRLFPT